MSAVPHFGTGDSTTATAASGTGSALTIAKPANVAVGDLLVGHFYSQFTGTVTTPPSGWTLQHAFNTYRSGGFYTLAVTDATVLAGLPSTWSMTSSGSGRLAWDIHRVTGADLTAPIDVVGVDVQNALATTVLSSVSPTNAGGLLEALAWWNNSSTTQSNYAVDAAMTDGEQVKSPATGNTSGIDVSYQQLVSSGATGTRSLVTTPTGASNGGFLYVIKASSSPAATAAYSGSGTFSATVVQNYAVTAAFSGSGSFTTAQSAQTAAVTAAFGGSGTFTASTAGNVTANAPFSGSGTFAATVVQNYAVTAAFSGSGSFTDALVQKYALTAPFSGSGTFSAAWQTPVQKWMATQPLYAAHRGGSADWPQSTMFAYDNAVAWNKDMALEVSVWQSADGVWYINHDDTLATTGQWASSAQITTSTASTLDTVVTTVGSYPLMRLTTLLTKYGGKRVIIIDDKGSQDVSGLITLLNANGGTPWYISKSYYTSVAYAGGMRTAGYYTLGYFYDVDTANIAANQSKFDVLMEEYNASGASWTAILSYGKPVMAHIVATAAQKATGLANGAQGFMASGVVEVVPATGTPASFSGSGTFSATVVQKYDISVPFGGSGSFTDTVVQQYAVAAPFGGSGAFTNAAVQKYNVAAPFSGSGSLTINAAQQYLITAPFNGSGTFSATVAGQVLIDALYSGSGTFSATVVQHYNVAAPFNGNGTFVAIVGSATDFAIYVWDGAALVPATVSVWNGMSLIPATVSEIV